MEAIHCSSNPLLDARGIVSSMTMLIPVYSSSADDDAAEELPNGSNLRPPRGRRRGAVRRPGRRRQPAQLGPPAPLRSFPVQPHTDTLVADESPLAEVMNVAFAAHEIAATNVDATLDAFAAAGS